MPSRHNWTRGDTLRQTLDAPTTFGPSNIYVLTFYRKGQAASAMRRRRRCSRRCRQHHRRRDHRCRRDDDAADARPPYRRISDLSSSLSHYQHYPRSPRYC
uniref:Uncharacterized protein n=1 Tax=Trichogramma kaykai TaxID=54128 RepID=A0ABD2XCK2_9HYME